MQQHEKYIFYARTVKASSIRSLFESLKEILFDVNILCTPKDMRIKRLSKENTVLVNLVLLGESFEEYICQQPLVTLGINLYNTHKLIKSVGSSDILSIFITEDKPQIIYVRIENPDKNLMTTYQMLNMDVDEVYIEIPDATSPSVIILPSPDFQRICRDMSNISDTTIEIRNVEDQLIFSCRGQFASQETILHESKNSIQFRQTKKDNYVSGTFSLKILNQFAKASTLSNTIEMYLENNFALILVFSVHNMGTLTLVLAPQDTSVEG